jgi:Raf kinase inhibitor-like YbhB/YbcL family protein
MKSKKVIMGLICLGAVFIASNALGMTVTSTSYNYSANIPQANACTDLGGSNRSPQLSLGNIPSGTQAFALIMDDPDAPGGTFVHWLMYWNSSSITSINENSTPSGAVQGTNHAGTANYFGPCPPSNHRYLIRVYALNATLSLGAGFTRTQWESAISGRILDSNVLLGYYPSGGGTPCNYTLSPYAEGCGAAGTQGTVTVTPSSSSCSWTAVSNASWITVTSGSGGTGSGTVAYSVAANTTGSTRTGTMAVAGSTVTVNQTGLTGSNVPLYFPHVDTSLPWQTEIAVINTGDQAITGTLRGMSNDGQLVETRAVTLAAHGRRQLVVAEEFMNHTNIGYIIFETDSAAVQGYTKFYQAGVYRAAIPAVKEVNTSDIYISHIDSSALWWTGASLVNTTSARKDLTITFNDGRSVPYTLDANQHRTFTIGGLLNEPLQPDIRSAVITNAGGVIGLELFGSIGSATQMDGILLTDKTASTLYYPHVASDNVWWTGIVAYNPAESAATITITPYSAQGALLATSTLPIAGKGKYVGIVAGLGLPAQTAWFRIDSTRPLSGFELFGTADGTQLAAYAGNGGTGAKSGVFAKIEKNGGWTGIAFVNTEEGAAFVTLTAYNDSGAVVATQVLPVGGHAKVVNLAEAIFMQDISGATYIAYSSDKNVVGFQLNGTSDSMMLDGLLGL